MFKKLLDVEIKNFDLMDKAKVSENTFYKIKDSENVTTDVLLRISNILKYNISEMVEYVSIEDGGKTSV